MVNLSHIKFKKFQTFLFMDKTTQLIKIYKKILDTKVE